MLPLWLGIPGGLHIVIYIQLHWFKSQLDLSSFSFAPYIILYSQIAGSSSKNGGNSPLLQSHQPIQPSQAAASTSSPPSQQQQQEVIVADTTSRSVVVHLICPICNRSIPHTELSSHFASCLQEVRSHLVLHLT